MGASDPFSSSSTVLFRFVAVMVLFLSITASGLQVLAGLSTYEHPDILPPVPMATLFIPPILSLIAGIALSTLLEGIARLVTFQPAERQDNTAAQVNLMMTIAELQSTLPALIAEAIRRGMDKPQSGESPASTTVDPDIQQHLERMVKLLEEMKELSMLDDSQRKNKRQLIAQRRKMSRLEEVAALLQQGSWAQADAHLCLLESLHPGDADVLACRNQLDDARTMDQANEWEQLTGQVDDLLALSQYSQAIDCTNRFLQSHPAHSEAPQLIDRIREEQRRHIENTATRLYEEIKASVENRQWRTALDGIQKFLDRFPEHGRADKIRRQIRVIQKNAEIEERHENEDRLKELINARRFGEAADLSEDLLARFPNSPQAAYLSDLLPKLREKSIETEGAITQ
jgi:outer membrane protein assembly factor BamD (BamD/ComL family)